MTKEEIRELIQMNLFNILPELELETINLDEDFEDLGVNSVDRAEIRNGEK